MSLLAQSELSTWITIANTAGCLVMAGMFLKFLGIYIKDGRDRDKTMAEHATTITDKWEKRAEINGAQLEKNTEQLARSDATIKLLVDELSE